jgi:hypothetical protein
MWVPLLNLLSRWVLFGVAAYKAYRERSPGWMILTAAFFIAAFDPEKLLLEPLGFSLIPETVFVLDMVNTSFQGVLLLLASEHLNSPPNSLRNSSVALLLGVLAYIWIVITNVSDYPFSFTVKTLVPLLIYAAGYVYMAFLLYENVISRRFIQLLFPAGMLLLGLLNATYPVTATWNWFVPYGFFLGTLFRVMMAVGALDFVLWPMIITKPDVPYETPSGAFICSSWEEATDAFGDLKGAPNLIFLTREEIRSLKERLDPNALVFWITRVVEGEILDSPKVYAISPTKIDILIHLIAGAIEKNYRLVVVDAVEYLIVENGFEQTFKFLLNVKDRVIIKGGAMILIVSEEALNERQVRILEREFKRK